MIKLTHSYHPLIQQIIQTTATKIKPAFFLKSLLLRW